MIKYVNSKPTLAAYKKLYESTGWTTADVVPDEVLQAAIDNSWYWISAYDDQTLIGVGRLVSDGVYYAHIHDIIVDPKYRNQDISASIVEMLKEKCLKNSFRRVWLFPGTGQVGFYLRNDSENRPSTQQWVKLINEFQS
ncbi:MAG: GNAT family N-acetyltransferase [Deltaproteobacteria bacterium HGW-Deltaproteobacteria-6]|jgi:GNAT superfamily N-acetyltransferase|nr:MAG: GNAT family N-acetyltransferase [Deltaproteobacteria bacterium HGW-Deltaproteobacteria-6]